MHAWRAARAKVSAAPGSAELDPATVDATLGVLLKYQDDLARITDPPVSKSCLQERPDIAEPAWSGCHNYRKRVLDAGIGIALSPRDEIS
jgi:hypothetical protein